MPQKKNFDKICPSPPKKTTKEKPPRKSKAKEKKEKPKLKTPTVVKVKPPSIKIKFRDSSNLTPINEKSKGDVSPELSPAAKRKLDLANEVALVQLKKTPSPKIELKPPVDSVVKKRAIKRKFVTQLEKPDGTEIEVRKRGRPKKNKQNVPKEEPPKREVETCTESPETQTNTEVPKKKRVIVKKEPIKRTRKKSDFSESEAKIKVTNKRKADSTSATTPLVIQKKLEKHDTVVNNRVMKPKVDNIPDFKKSKSKAKFVGKKMTLNSISSIEHNSSPSILKEASDILKDTTETEISRKESKSNPAPVDSRKTSTSECLSWTKDISSSSTTTCMTVNSNDFVRINKKLPLIQLTDVKSVWRNSDRKSNDSYESDSESSSSSSSSSGSSSSSSSSQQSSRNSVSNSLKLSASSITPTKPDLNSCPNNVQNVDSKEDDWEDTLKKLKNCNKMRDIESIVWVDQDSRNFNPKIEIRQDKIFQIVNTEKDLLKACELLLETCGTLKTAAEESINATSNNNMNVAKNKLISLTDKSEDDDRFTSSKSKNVMFDQSCTQEENLLQAPRVCNSPDGENDNFTADTANNLSYDQSCNNDDDDALSLFAESITGIESSKYNSSANSVCANASEYEEYVPKPKKPIHFNTITYIPSKIDKVETPLNNKPKSVCEKQNADSTSIYKEIKSTFNTQKSTGQNQGKKITLISEEILKPAFGNMITSQVYQPDINKSLLFRGTCFYYLMSRCKKIYCKYSHRSIDRTEVQSKLKYCTDEEFIQEYMLIRMWRDIRKLYGICYVSECVDRKLTRLLVEMCIDFISKAKPDSAEDEDLSMNVTEITLLYLNNIDLNTCGDLLQHELGRGVQLCDILMKTIGETQNFSRFKMVFVNLTAFMSGIGRQFDLDVSNHILERVCILPTEEPLALAMLTIIKNTKPKIFENSMMPKFENYVSSLDLKLYGKLNSIREQATVNSADILNEGVPPRVIQEVNNLNMINKEERYTSPDTTKIDNMNKSNDEYVQQCVKMMPPRITNHYQMRHPAPHATSKSWRGKNYSNMHYARGNLGHRFVVPMHRPPSRQLMRPPPAPKRRYDQRHMTLGPPPPKNPRRPGPEYF